MGVLSESLRWIRLPIQQRAKRRCVVVLSKPVPVVPRLQCVRRQFGGPEAFRDRGEVALDAAENDVRDDYALAILIGQARKHIAVSVGDLRSPRYRETYGTVS